MSFPVVTATHGLELNNKERVRLLQMSVEDIKALHAEENGKRIYAEKFLN
jgi:hypothetical protein